MTSPEEQPSAETLLAHYFQKDNSRYLPKGQTLYLTTHFSETLYRHITEVELPEDAELTPLEQQARAWLHQVVTRPNPGHPKIIGRDLHEHPLDLGASPVQSLINFLAHQLGLPEGTYSFQDLVNRLIGNDVLFILIGKEQLEKLPSTAPKVPLRKQVLDRLTGNYVPDYATFKTKLAKIATVIDE